MRWYQADRQVEARGFVEHERTWPGWCQRERETTPMVTNWGEKETTADASHNVDCGSDAVIKLTCLVLFDFFQSFQGPCQQL